MGLGNVSELLAPRVLTTSIRTFDTTATDSRLRELFRQGRRTVEVDSKGRVDYVEVRSSRKLAPVVGLMSPTPQRGQKQFVTKTCACFRVAEKRVIPWTRLFQEGNVGDPNAPLRPNAEGVIRDTFADMLLEINKTIERACSLALRQGGINMAVADVDGSDVPVAQDFGVATANFAAKWNDPATKILGVEIPAFQETFAANCEKPIERALINGGVYAKIVGNDEVQKFGKNWEMARNFLQANVQGKDFLGGLDLAQIRWDLNNYGFKTDAGVRTKWLQDAHAIFLPGDVSEVLGMAEGEQPIPVNVIGSVGGEIPRLGKGLVSYAKWSDDPVAVELFATWFGTPIVLWPAAVLDATLWA